MAVQGKRPQVLPLNRVIHVNIWVANFDVTGYTPSPIGKSEYRK